MGDPYRKILCDLIKLYGFLNKGSKLLESQFQFCFLQRRLCLKSLIPSVEHIPP